jgi:hypothetical protein
LRRSETGSTPIHSRDSSDRGTGLSSEYA